MEVKEALHLNTVVYGWSAFSLHLTTFIYVCKCTQSTVEGGIKLLFNELSI